tara:strand:+ start:20619 stop:20927 length:309 start_codon:yes stop_codon:yes gene_type:complete
MKFSPFVAIVLILVSLNECLGQAPLVQEGDANAHSESDATSRRPNVIVILADDLSVGDLAGGDGSPTRTPNLDRLANESIQFSQAYSGSCVCVPASGVVDGT